MIFALTIAKANLEFSLLVLDIFVLQQNSFVHKMMPGIAVVIAFLKTILGFRAVFSVLYIAQFLHLLQANLTKFKCDGYVMCTGLKCVHFGCRPDVIYCTGNIKCYYSVLPK